MRRKGFTLVELLVVIAIIALLMGILMPALARVRQIAYQMMCGTNLSGVGKALVLYANDYDEDYPIAGASGTNQWTDDDKIVDWLGETREDAFGTDATVTSCLYLLIKFSDVQPKQFMCKGDAGTKEFKLSKFSAQLPSTVSDVTDVWDFGNGAGDENLPPGAYCSYSYHLPYRDARSGGDSAYPLNVTSDSRSPVCADRNPGLDKNAAFYYSYKEVAGNDFDVPDWGNEPEFDPDGVLNSSSHQMRGQNVLFNDIHVKFAKMPNVGIDQDNIYITWPDYSAGDDKPDAEERQMGSASLATSGTGEGSPMCYDDAFLVNEKND